MKDTYTQTSPVNVLVISPFFYPHIGGSQRYIEELYVHLMRSHPHIKVTVLAYNTDHAPKIERHRGLLIYRIPCVQILPGQFAIPNPFALIGKLIELSGKRFDYVHTHIRFFDATWWAWLFARIIRAKSVFTEHVATHPVHSNSVVEQIAKYIDLTIAKYAIGQYTLVTTTNTPAKTFLTQNLGITKPVYVSYGGVDTRFFSPKKEAKRTLVISYAGRLIWSKGLIYLLGAIKTLHPKLPKPVRFVFAGKGDLEDKLRSDAEKFHLTKRIQFAGPLDSRGVRDLLRNSDIFVHPSHHNEGFPNSILEAASAGTFVIASDNAGTSEIIEDKRTGLIIPQKNTKAIATALTWAVDHVSERKRICKESRKDMQRKFDWKIVSEQFYTLLQEKCTLENLGMNALLSQAV